MFIDGLKVVQDFPVEQIPLNYRECFVKIDLETGKLSDKTQERSHTFRYEGSHSTSVGIRIRLGRIEVDGNPSRINRLDNLFGYTTIDQCVAVYNSILSSLGLPQFTKSTKTFFRQSPDGKKSQKVSDGAIIQEIHITTNRTTGKGNSLDYIKALSTQKYKNSIPNLHTNGCSVDWKSKLNNAKLIYPTIYDKANELEIHLFPKIKRQHGKDSNEYKYIQKLRQYCLDNGVVRFEQKLKSEYLRRNDLCFYGLIDFKILEDLHEEFLKIDQRLKVNAMTLENITEQLINNNICQTIRSANTTAFYAYQWMHGSQMDLAKTQTRIHRARLRKIGIDIGLPCDITRFSPIKVTQVREIEVSDLPIPHWYKKPVSPLRLVA